jgi:sporulation protein YlmC with PRC-barrel domain
MAMRLYSFLKDKSIISSDAFIVGNVVDVYYEPGSWTVRSIGVRGSKGLGDVLGASSFRKPQFSLNIGTYDINDVILIPEARDQLQKALVADNGGTEKATVLIGKKVVTSDLITIGTIADIGIDLDTWRINSFKVKIEKGVAEALDVKLGLINKTVSGLLTSHISSVTDGVNLSRRVEDLRGNFTLD